MFDNNKKLSGKEMLLLGSLFVAAPVIGALLGNRDQEEKSQTHR